MRRFRFPLAALERLLVHREDEAKLRAARAAAERERAAGLLGHLVGLRQAARDERVERRSLRALPVAEEHQYETYFERLARAVEGQSRQVARAGAEHEARQRELRGAATRRRLLGLVRERRRAEYRREALREMTRRLDEVGARQAAARGPEEPMPAA